MKKVWLKPFVKLFFAIVFFVYLGVSYSLRIPSVNAFFISMIEQQLTQSFQQKVTISSVKSFTGPKSSSPGSKISAKSR